MNKILLFFLYIFTTEQRKSDGEIVTKHDRLVCERKNARHVEQVSISILQWNLLGIGHLECDF